MLHFPFHDWTQCTRRSMAPRRVYIVDETRVSHLPPPLATAHPPGAKGLAVPTTTPLETP
jgi:hypothetical protein